MVLLSAAAAAVMLAGLAACQAGQPSAHAGQAPTHASMPSNHAGIGHWLIAEYAATELSRTPAGLAFVRALDNPSTYEILTRNRGPDLLPRATHVDDFDSYAAIERAFARGAVPAEVRVILYDDERWPGTPLGEQQQPFRYVALAEALVHRHGLLLLNSPAPDLTTTLEPGQNGNYRGYLQERLGTLAARADVFDIQAQHAGPPASYVAFARQAVAQARAASSQAVVLLGITTNGETSQDLIGEVDATRALAGGYWLNVIGGTSGVDTVIPLLQALGY